MLVNLTTWTDEELISLRDKLHTWCLRRKQSKWGNRFWLGTALFGAYGLLIGFVGIFFGDMTVLNFCLVTLGAVICFSWYQSDKKRKSNISFLAQINAELMQRSLSMSDGIILSESDHS
ncbi:MAG: hypothetical protein ITD42_03450 [Nitrosospira sp.]|nr:hypothetical protein [Nitrosospira sp.]MBI0414606.1 hypothetical protein [Nitrosospira sp.]MBI0415398.1 hypothetical protein [Nitrosospira sp.]MBI0417363.1 hypothetical protein [Nitrosospira sp.]MBI0417645.1 hypothetical protein [Nitrosospira sp.]